MVPRKIVILFLDIVLLIIFIILGYSIPGFFKMLYPLAILGGFLILLNKIARTRKER